LRSDILSEARIAYYPYRNPEYGALKPAHKLPRQIIIANAEAGKQCVVAKVINIPASS